MFAFPSLGWVDSSALVPNTMAAPALSIANVVCPAMFCDDWDSPVARVVLGLSDVCLVCARPSDAFISRCADALPTLGLFFVKITHSEDWLSKLGPGLAAVPAPSPFQLAAGDIVEPTPFLTQAVAAVPGRPAVPRVAAVRAARVRIEFLPSTLRVLVHTNKTRKTENRTSTALGRYVLYSQL